MTNTEKRNILVFFALLVAALMTFRSCEKKANSVQLSEQNFTIEMNRAKVLAEKKIIVDNEIEQTTKQLDSLIVVRDTINVILQRSNPVQIQRGLDTLFNY